MFSSSDFELTELDKFINQFGQQDWKMAPTFDKVET
jgi:hypothetical protein